MIFSRHLWRRFLNAVKIEKWTKVFSFYCNVEVKQEMCCFRSLMDISLFPITECCSSGPIFAFSHCERDETSSCNRKHNVSYSFTNSHVEDTDHRPVVFSLLAFSGRKLKLKPQQRSRVDLAIWLVACHWLTVLFEILLLFQYLTILIAANMKKIASYLNLEPRWTLAWSCLGDLFSCRTLASKWACLG